MTACTPVRGWARAGADMRSSSSETSRPLPHVASFSCRCASSGKANRITTYFRSFASIPAVTRFLNAKMAGNIEVKSLISAFFSKKKVHSGNSATRLVLAVL